MRIEDLKWTREPQSYTVSSRIEAGEEFCVVTV